MQQSAFKNVEEIFMGHSAVKQDSFKVEPLSYENISSADSTLEKVQFEVHDTRVSQQHQ